MRTEFDYLMRADTLITDLETKGYRVYADRYGGIMVKGPGTTAVYNNFNEYEGQHDGERLLLQAEAIYEELGLQLL